ncbi:MAG: metalloregulator ArsR/SmtB family transcription factor [Clostridia bacterium]|nr:metalloregulator ArsR/SmtB family transcription factor [Clostridia bacterium]
MTENEALLLFKCLADRSRLQILKSLLQEDMYVERLAQRLGLTSATISFHLRKLEEAGAVTSRKEQYYTMYAIRRDVFMERMIDLISEESSEQNEQIRREAEYRRKVEESFFRYGKLVSIPAQRKKKRICLEKIAREFQPGRVYQEAEVNEIIERFHEDYCTLRRDMIAEKLCERDGQAYTFTAER